jgi:hypothetical protein
MKDHFIEFSLCFSFDDYYFEERKEVDAELYHEIQLKFRGGAGWPVGIIFVYF